MCDNCDSIDLHNSAITIADNFLIEKAMMSEVSQIARAELRLRKYIEKKWNKRKDEAIKKATNGAKEGEYFDKIHNDISLIMNKWSNDISPTYNAEMEDVYRLARTAGWKKVQVPFH